MADKSRPQTQSQADEQGGGGGGGRPPRLCYPGAPGSFPAATVPWGQGCAMPSPRLGRDSTEPRAGVICAFLARRLLRKSGLPALAALPALPRNQRQVLGRWTPQRAAPAPAGLRMLRCGVWGNHLLPRTGVKFSKTCPDTS